MKKNFLLAASSLLLYANCINDLNNTFLKKELQKNKNNEISCKKISKNLELFNIKDTQTNKKATLWLVKLNDNKKYIVIGQLIDKNGKVLNNNIINTDIVKKGVAFTFGKGKKEIYIVTDPECPYCVRLFNNNKNKLINDYKVNIIFMPLTKIHPQAEKMVKYILAAKTNKERFKRFEELESKNFENFNKFDFDKLDEKNKKRILEDYNNSLNAAKELNARGTPSIYNDRFIPIN